MRSKFKWILTLVIAFLLQFSFAQEKIVKGIVSDAIGPLSGVNIVVKNTKNGTTTNFDGGYSIKANEGDILVFTYVSMKDKEVLVTGTTMNVTMEEDVAQLENVVVTALGLTVAKNQLASSYSKVSDEVLKTTGETNVLRSLSAKASNVNIVSSSGDPGAGSYIQIRGQNTITGNTQPLFVIDGIPVSNDEIDSGTDGVTQQSRLNDINPADIESVQILKGASASALWGYRAANGIVIITTKKGKKGKIKVDLSSTYSYDQPNIKFETQDTFGQGSNGSWARNSPTSYGDYIPNRSGGSDVFNTAGNYFVSNNGNRIYSIAANGKNSKDNFNDSNYDAVINNGFSLNNHVGISGGGESGNFYLGIGHLQQEGIIRSSSYERTSIDLSTQNRIAEKTTFKSKFSFSAVNSNRIQQGSNTSGLLLGLYRGPADFDIRDYIGTYFNAATGGAYLNSHRAYRQDIGTFDLSTGRDVNPGYNNPLWTTDIQKNPNKVYRYLGGFQLQHEFSKYFSVLARLGLDGYSDQRITMFPISSVQNGGNGDARESVTDYNQFNADIIGLGDVKFNESLSLNYTLGFNFSETSYTQRGGSYINFLTDTDKFTYNNSVIANRTTFLDRQDSRTNGTYFSTAFNLKDFLFLTLGGRLETSSVLDPNLKNYFYPSVELGYLFTNHLKSSILTKGKLRGTYGQVAITPLPYRTSTYAVGGAGAEGFGPAYDAAAYSGSFNRSSLLGNANIKPEIKTEYEVGIDLEFIERINLNATYYTNETVDLNFFSDLAPSSGFSNVFTNAGDITNKGFEVELDATIIKNGDFKWNIYGNWATNRNEITRLENTESLFLNGFAGTSSRAVLGAPLGTLWGGRWDRDAAGNQILDANGFPTVAPTEGIIGDPNPKWRGGLGTRIEYKGFALNTLFDMSYGGDLWDGTNGALNNFGTSLQTANIVTFANQTDASGIIASNGAAASTLGWVNPDGSYSVRGNLQDFGAGPVLLNQSWYTGNGGGFGPVGEQFIKSATWAKLREMTLSYTLNGRIIENTGIDAITLSFTGRNLWLWTEDKTLGQDPESNLTGASNGRGLQYFNHPNSKSFIGSINIKF